MLSLMNYELGIRNDELMLHRGHFAPAPRPAAGEQGRKTAHLYLLGGEAAQKIQNNPIPRPWGRG